MALLLLIFLTCRLCSHSPTHNPSTKLYSYVALQTTLNIMLHVGIPWVAFLPTVPCESLWLIVPLYKHSFHPWAFSILTRCILCKDGLLCSHRGLHIQKWAGIHLPLRRKYSFSQYLSAADKNNNVSGNFLKEQKWIIETSYLFS
jgi:hypothetical protein